jgi:hypothetical protein
MQIATANFNRLKAPLQLSISHFQRVFQTYIRPFWQAPEVPRRFLKIELWGGCRCELALWMAMRISII